MLEAQTSVSQCLGLNLSPASSQLCNLGPVIQPLCACFLTSKARDNVGTLVKDGEIGTVGNIRTVPGSWSP